MSLQRQSGLRLAGVCRGSGRSVGGKVHGQAPGWSAEAPCLPGRQCAPAFPLRWGGKWSRRRGRELSRRPHVVSGGPSLWQSEARPGRGAKRRGRGGQSRRAVGTCPAPVSSSYPGHPTPGLGTTGPGAAAGETGSTKRARQRLGSPQTQELSPTPEGAAAGATPGSIKS